MAHRTVARRAEHTDIVKGSRFAAVVARVEDEADGRERLAEARARHPEATHHAFALRLGELVRMGDDGEPGGTAGRPMLEVLLKRDLDHVVAIVSRTFGGTKLGAGGLARAYGAAVARALDAAGELEVPDVAVLEVLLPYGFVDAVLRAADGDPAVLEAVPVYQHGDARVRLELRAEAVDAWHDRLGDLTRGEAVARVVPPAAQAARGPRATEGA